MNLLNLLNESMRAGQQVSRASWNVINSLSLPRAGKWATVKLIPVGLIVALKIPPSSIISNIVGNEQLLDSVGAVWGKRNVNLDTMRIWAVMGCIREEAALRMRRYVAQFMNKQKGHCACSIDRMPAQGLSWACKQSLRFIFCSGICIDSIEQW